MKKPTTKLLLTNSFIIVTLLTSCAQHPSIATDNNIDDKVTIYFARHGKTLFNTYDLVQGWADTPLTNQGIKLARYLGEGFKNIQFDAYYTSDAGRQRETMQVLLEQKGVKDYKIRELKGLREVFFGGFEGRPNTKMVYSSMKLSGYNSVDAFYKGYQAGNLPIDVMIDSIAKTDPRHQAENYQQVKTRTQAALQTIVQNAHNNHEKTILAISSGMSMQAMISDLTDNKDKNKPLANATVIKIIYKNGQYNVSEIGNIEYVNKGKEALNQQQMKLTE
ncbi:histidine phosphatase family protein [Gilliamella sp. Pas-s25]|uniref:histidine phosphatase family protein n=1 Tax=Gilliamella sp. Pas-s25 TaxID=2687310 RepID=UPI00135D795E|nr:histidine phosphatase family protein [Gilliamella sp. Pas-s25]MWP63044.1 histidine phosphatase family protein [Gilliamella sp. Pas-s25]